MNRVVVPERDRTSRRDGYIEAVTVVHFVELVLGLEVSQLGIGQHGFRNSPEKIPCSDNQLLYA